MTPQRALQYPPGQTEVPPLRDELLQELKAQGQSPAAIIRQIEALRWNQNVDGYIFRPEPHASQTAKGYIRAIYPLIEQDLPEPEVDSDGLGGIEIQWNYQGRRVILACRPNRSQKDFIYSQHGRYEVIEASPLNLKE